jgi:phosphoribosyl 1,2-cyclic phosphate phosphodiesterase
MKKGNFRVTFLGTGPSLGVPIIGCECKVCASENPRNRRMRSSIRVDTEEGTFIVDAGPDLRHQALRSGLKRLDAVVLTHAHADHVLGLDEMRIFNFRTRRPMPLYGTEETLFQIQKFFFYAFDDQNRYPWKPQYDLRAIEPGVPFRVADLELAPLLLGHGGTSVLGFRMGGGAREPSTNRGGPFAYCTDVHELPERAYEALEGVETFVLNALRLKKHATHLSLDEALAAIERVGARRSFLTHLSHEFDYDEIKERLPSGVELAHDGLVLEFSG